MEDGSTAHCPAISELGDLNDLSSFDEVVPFVVELRDGDPVSELSQTGEAATSGAAVVMGG